MSRSSTDKTNPYRILCFMEKFFLLIGAAFCVLILISRALGSNFETNDIVFVILALQGIILVKITKREIQ